MDCASTSKDIERGLGCQSFERDYLYALAELVSFLASSVNIFARACGFSALALTNLAARPCLDVVAYLATGSFSETLKR